MSALSSGTVLLTGIGSLPFSDLAESWKFSLRFDMPFRPELVISHPEQSLLGQLKSWPKSSFAPIPDFVSTSLQGRKLALHYPGPDVCHYLENKMSYTEYLNFLSTRISEDILELKSLKIKFVLFLDIPNFGQWAEQNADKIAALQSTMDDFHSEWGIHCCGKFSFRPLEILAPTYFSFDYSAYPESLHGIEKMFKNLSITKMIFGLANAKAEHTDLLRMQILRGQIQAGENIFISPTCGIPRADAQKVWDELQQIKKFLVRDTDEMI